MRRLLVQIFFLCLLFDASPVQAADELEHSRPSEGAGAGNPPLTKPGETFVFTVDQTVTGEPKRWTHRVAEAGDYQLGMAWVEVQSGREVEVTIMAAGGLDRNLAKW